MYIRKYWHPKKPVLCDNFQQRLEGGVSVQFPHGIHDSPRSPDWEDGLAEVSYKAPNRQILQGALVDVVSSINILIYCDLITPQFVGSDNVRLLRNIICPTQLGNHLFQNVYYLPVEKALFQDIHVELRVLDGEHAEFENSGIPTNIVLHFRRI